MKWRSMRLATLLTLILAVAVLLASCAPAPAEEATTPPEEEPTAAEATADEEPTAAEDEGEQEMEEPTGPITIGLMAPYSGPLAAAAEDSNKGWDLFWQLRGSTEVAGREIEWVTGDTAMDPSTGITQATALVEQQSVDFIVGPFVTDVGMGVAEELGRRGIPQFIPILSDDNVTMREKENLPYTVRIAGWNASQNNLPYGQWVYDQGFEQLSTIGYDLQFSYEHCGSFLASYVAAGGEVLTQTWHPITTEDFSPFIAQLQQSNPPAVLVCNSGLASIRFANQWAEFGLMESIPLFATETVTDQSNLRSMEDSAVGIISSGHFAEGRDAPATQEFVNAYLEEYGELPSYFSAANYTAAGWLVDAIEDVDGDISDKDAFIAAVRAIELEESALGPMELDENDHPIQDIYVREVQVRDDGLLWNAVIDTFEDVGQFWTFDPEEYMDQPLYSRDYQGF